MATKARVKKVAVTPAEEAASALPPAVQVAMTKRQVCAALQISLRQLSALISAGQFPRPDVPIGKRLRWYSGTFNAWLAGQREKP